MMLRNRKITVVETASFLATAKGVLSEADRGALVDFLADRPEQGVLLKGGGGLRKLRFARAGRGKSAGVRVIYLYHDDRMPLFILAMFAKNEKANLTDAELAALATAAARIVETYGA